MPISPKTFNNCVVFGTKHIWFAGPDYGNLYSYTHEHTVLSTDTVEANKSKLSKQNILWEEADWKLQRITDHLLLATTQDCTKDPTQEQYNNTKRCQANTNHFGPKYPWPKK